MVGSSLPLETEGTSNGREQFGCSLKRKKLLPISKLERVQLVLSVMLINLFTFCFRVHC
jgi:hypothetical protein